jgi:hypothetical protein
MKKIVQLVIGLLIINSSCIMGMEENRVEKFFENSQAHRPLERRVEAPKQQMHPARLETSILPLVKGGCSVLSMGSLRVLTLSGAADCEKTICLNSTMVAALWVTCLLTAAQSGYEVHKSKSFFESRKKSMLLTGVQFSSFIVIAASLLMMNDCPQGVKCLEMGLIDGFISSLAAGYCFYEASLN